MGIEAKRSLGRPRKGIDLMELVECAQRGDTQQQAARAMGMAFGTLKRHLGDPKVRKIWEASHRPRTPTLDLEKLRSAIASGMTTQRQLRIALGIKQSAAFTRSLRASPEAVKLIKSARTKKLNVAAAPKGLDVPVLVTIDATLRERLKSFALNGQSAFGLLRLAVTEGLASPDLARNAQPQGKGGKRRGALLELSLLNGVQDLSKSQGVRCETVLDWMVERFLDARPTRISQALAA